MSVETKITADARLEFDGRRCIHSRHCVLSRPDVFVPNTKGEWLHPENANGEELMHLARNCPSGAIRVQRRDGGEDETPPLVNLIRTLENGPLAVTADLRLPDQPAQIRATLCRCGHSENKPYCDGSHAKSGFQATGESATQESKPLAQRNGPLQVQAIKDGPLRVTGNLELVSGTGRTIDRTVETFLCRCGHSARKPYCDGTHKKIGFHGG